MRRRRSRSQGEKPKATVDMTSLIDLTFLLLVTFIVTLPALEQGIQINLPEQKKNPELPHKQNKANEVTIDVHNNIYPFHSRSSSLVGWYFDTTCLQYLEFYQAHLQATFQFCSFQPKLVLYD